ncbi:hypothetical protein Pan44_04240 [Caulifigura coniformis]|uniref:Rod shape-determining protein MreD n=1 Tax=Caulifigura coniformis TaxID=2527983 RepID=A0A517S8I0_9PLAN|nr:hypothetical protein [Caulifigura coniformis]QDT52413.1 hypothetical protein Pan44_04240 [Caulifigura coniformis]
MMIVRMTAIALATSAVYFGLALEAVSGGRTLLPQTAAVAIILAAWSLPLAPAVAIASAVGLCCDAIGVGPLGPGMIAGTMAACLGSVARRRWELESPLAAALFGIALGAGFLAGPLVASTMLAESPMPAETLHLHLARAISSALAATAMLLALRTSARLLKATTRLLLNV